MDDIFEPTARSIYKYNNGVKVVAADPLVLRGILTVKALEHGKTLQAWIDAGNKIDIGNASEIEVSEAWSALMTLADISLEAFSLVKFDEATGEGADTAHALGVLNHFHVWCEKKNRQHASPPISIPRSESTSETPPITTTSSVSLSTCRAYTAETLLPSP